MGAIGHVSDCLQDLPVLLSLLSSILYDYTTTPPDKAIANPLKVDTIAKRLMSNHGKVRLD